MTALYPPQDDQRRRRAGPGVIALGTGNLHGDPSRVEVPEIRISVGGSAATGYVGVVLCDGVVVVDSGCVWPFREAAIDAAVRAAHQRYPHRFVPGCWGWIPADQVRW